MTSNIGARQLKDFGQGIGFNTNAKKANEKQHSKSVIEKALKRAFSPEFLNRIDDIILFNNLEKIHINKIIDIEMNSTIQRINALGYTVKITEQAKDFIAEKGFDIKFGARPLKRAIQKYFEDPLSEEIINSKIKEGDNIDVKLHKNKTELIINIKKPKKKKKDTAQ